MKILVCGGRDYNKKEVVYNVLDLMYDNIQCIVHGGARGVDSLAQTWAEERGVKTLVFPADWEKYGKSAGPIRNKQMLDENPDLMGVLAFPGGNGTKNMINLAVNRNISVLKVGW